MASIYNWNTDAAQNTGSDSSINWSEGMAPSGVNDSARFMMARIAELLTDIGGGLTAGGTANALTVATESAFTEYADGVLVAFRAIADNTSTATLNVNNVGGKPIVRFSSSGETSLAGGEIQSGGIYTAKYHTGLNSGSGAWVLLNPTPASAVVEVPSGAVSAFAMNSAPSGWLKCNGAAVSRTTYPALFAAVGTTWGTGDGSSTFNLPDLRGEFIRGWADGGSVDSGRTFASSQSDELESHTHTASTSSSGSHDHTVSRATSTNGSGSAATGGAASGQISTSTAGAHTHAVTVNSTGGSETRPRNKALLYCIKT